MRKILIPVAVVAIAALGLFYVMAQVVQQDSTTGSVTVVGDVLTVSPTTDWLTVLSFSEAQNSGVQELVFTNANDFDVLITELNRIEQVPPKPNAFAGTMDFRLGLKSVACPDPLTFTLAVDVGGRGLNWVVPANGSAIICGQLDYDGALGAVDETVALNFVFSAEPVTP